MGGAGWAWVKGHLHGTTAAALLAAGYKTIYINGGMILHKAFDANPECALPGNNLRSMLHGSFVDSYAHVSSFLCSSASFKSDSVKK